MSPNRALVWDLPTRLFHWTLVLLVALQYASGEFGWLDLQWHVPAGYAALALLLFRAAWGFVGSDSARFAQFLRGPGAIRRYLRGGQRVVHTHNPLGGWAALLMLLWLLAIALTGLASSDDIDVAGPLAAQLDDATVRAALATEVVDLEIALGVGEARTVAYGCDLTKGYIEENAAYYSS